MKFLRFSDICASGQATGKRVFIRADLNVPQDDEGHITEDTRIRASIPAIQMALEAGAAVMVAFVVLRHVQIGPDEDALTSGLATGANVGKTQEFHGAVNKRRNLNAARLDGVPDG